MDARKLTTAIPRFLIRVYQTARVGSVPRCRFYPRCSEYMAHALDTHGLFYGTRLGLKRIFKCHPWHAGGYDPLPTITSPLTADHS